MHYASYFSYYNADLCHSVSCLLKLVQMSPGPPSCETNQLMINNSLYLVIIAQSLSVIVPIKSHTAKDLPGWLLGSKCVCMPPLGMAYPDVFVEKWQFVYDLI